MKLSMLLPVYNEENHINKVLKSILRIKFTVTYEIIVINDGSTDDSLSEIKKIKSKQIKVITYNKNKGKGYAVQQGLKLAKGNLFIIQDADFEYDPNEIPKLIKPLIEKQCDVVYGTRFLKYNQHNFVYYVGNQLITQVANLIYTKQFTDVTTCYKAFNKKVKDKLFLRENGFGFETEFTNYICKNKFKVKEVPITFKPRSRKQGKKIRMADGFIMLSKLLIYRFKN